VFLNRACADAFSAFHCFSRAAHLVRYAAIFSACRRRLGGSDVPEPLSYFDSEDDVDGQAVPAVLARKEVYSGIESLPGERCLEIFRLMVRTRALEERTIKMSKSGEGYFWVGGPGEEAFNVCLGLQVNKGHGPAYDYLHLHYRNAGVLMAMGMPMIEHIRQMAMTATDRHSLGRNFVGHYAAPEWNVLPVTSVIEVQYVMAPGTAMMQKRHGGEGVSIVVGGDAGTAEGDFTSCMVWSTRPGNELPVLMAVTNNGFGISTPARTQHSERRISERGDPFGIPGETVNGNDVVAVWHALERAFEYCRRFQRPYLLEAIVSRLHGHSSSSGAARVGNETDCLKTFEDKLVNAGVIHRELVEMIYHDAHEEAAKAVEQATSEPRPTAADVERFTYAPSSVDAVYPNDYTGLPR
jgi:2-oxoisovalerate dehydrogenase E1 component alpha subunit